jgi:hypothetical protein
MPVHKTTLKGKPAYQWGEHGTKYTGSDAKEKATKQGQAAYAHGYKGKGKK